MSFSQELAEPPDGHCTMLELTFEKPEEVDAKHSEPSAFCYQGHKPPFDTPWRRHHAVVKASDGNQVSLIYPS